MSDVKKGSPIGVLDSAKSEADKRWGVFSNMIRSHPKTGFFIGIGVGLGASFVLRMFF